MGNREIEKKEDRGREKVQLFYSACVRERKRVCA